MITPLVHLNGTSRDELIEQACNVIDALHDAGAALAKAAPNARDYYLGGPELLAQAQAQHDARMGALKALIADMEAQAQAISDA